MDIVLLVGRIVLGGYFISSGVGHFTGLAGMTGYAQSKGVPMAKLSVVVSGILLLIGGAGIILGAYVPLALLAIVLFLVPVSFMIHPFWKTTDPTAKMNDRIQFMKNMGLLGATLMLYATYAANWGFALNLVM